MMNRFSAVSRQLAVSLAIVAIGSAPALAASFTDVPGGFWAGNYIDFLSGRQVVTGYPDQTFRPNQAVTRAEFAAMLAKSQNLTLSSGATGFNDIPGGHWAAGAIGAVAQRGWITGYPGNLFMPNQPISQAEMYTIVSKVLGRPTLTDANAAQVLQTYQDANQIPTWARDSVATALQAGLGANDIAPTQVAATAHASRANIAASLAKLINPSFRVAGGGTPNTPVASQPTNLGDPVKVNGTLTATARLGEWALQGEDGKQYILSNPPSTQPSWFRNGAHVQLQGRLDTQAGSTQRPVVVVQSMTPDAVAESQVTITGTLQPAQTPNTWLIAGSDGKTYRLLNPQSYTGQSFFRYGSLVNVTGNLRPDVATGASEGTALVASQITAGQSQQSVTLTGTLQPTVEPGGWTLVSADGKKYVLLGTESQRAQTWFTAGTKVDVSGQVRADVPTIYNEGPVLQVSSLAQNVSGISGQQTVNLYFPNLVSMVRNPGSLTGEPVVRPLQGPDIPKKAVEALVQGPVLTEQVRGYYQDKDVSKLTVDRVDITGQTANVTLKAPSGFSFKNTAAPTQLNAQIAETLKQFGTVQTVNVSVVGSNNQVLWQNGQ